MHISLFGEIILVVIQVVWFWARWKFLLLSLQKWSKVTQNNRLALSVYICDKLYIYVWSMTACRVVYRYGGVGRSMWKDFFFETEITSKDVGMKSEGGMRRTFCTHTHTHTKTHTLSLSLPLPHTFSLYTHTHTQTHTFSLKYRVREREGERNFHVGFIIKTGKTKKLNVNFNSKKSLIFFLL